jgi:hypothetical protein
MRVPTIKEVMREQARFVKFQDGKLWYNILYTYEITKTTSEGKPYASSTAAQFDFPIDVTGEDAGGEFGSSEKAVTLMRWIRKHIDFLNAAKAGT